MNFYFISSLAAGTFALAACGSEPPTPYRQIVEGKIHTGHSVEQVEDGVYRVDFLGSPRTGSRTAMAFALFRAAELAQELKMSAFTVVKGPVDRSILEGSETYSRIEQLDGEGPDFDLMVRVVGPIIRIPIYAPPQEQPESKLVILKVRMHIAVPQVLDQRTFVTEEVLTKLGPRIVRQKTI